MKALLVKEARVLARPVAITVGVVLGLFVVVQVPLFVAGGAGGGVLGPWDELWWGYLTNLWALLMLFLGLLAGCLLIARDRSEGEVEFARLWPASRTSLWLAKLLAGIALVSAIYWASIAAIRLSMPADIHAKWLGARASAVPAEFWPLHFAATLLVFTIGFLFSTVRPSPFDAVFSSLLAILIVGSGMWLWFMHVVAARWGPSVGLWPKAYSTFGVAALILGALVGLSCLFASWCSYRYTAPLQFAARSRRGLGLGFVLIFVSVVGVVGGYYAFGGPNPGDIEKLGYVQVTPDGKNIIVAEPAGRHNSARRDTGLEKPYRLWAMGTDDFQPQCIARQPVWESGIQNNPRWVWVLWGPRQRGVYRANTRWVWLIDLRKMQLRAVPESPRAGSIQAGVTEAPRRSYRLAGRHVPSYRGVVEVSPDGRYMLAGKRVLSLGEEFRWTYTIPSHVSVDYFVGWAADDSRFYFISRADGDRQKLALWAMSAKTGKLRCVADAPDGIHDWYATVSPDGDWCAWWWQTVGDSEEGGACGTVLRNLCDGRRYEYATLCAIFGPRGWSLDGRHLVARDRDSGGASLITLDGGPSVCDLPAVSFSPSWSPDGSRCALLSAGQTDVPRVVRYDLRVIDTGGESVRYLSRASRTCTECDLRVAGWLDNRHLLTAERHTRLVTIDVQTGARELVFRTRRRSEGVGVAEEPSL